MDISYPIDWNEDSKRAFDKLLRSIVDINYNHQGGSKRLQGEQKEELMERIAEEIIQFLCYELSDEVE